MAGDCKIGRTNRLIIKVGKETGLGKGLDWEAGMAHQLNFQMIAYEKEAVFGLFLGHGYRQWPRTRESEPKLILKKKKSFKQDIPVKFKPRSLRVLLGSLV